MSEFYQGASHASGTSQPQAANADLRRELMEAFNMLDADRKGHLGGKEMKVGLDDQIALRAFGLKLPQKDQDDVTAANRSRRL